MEKSREWSAKNDPCEVLEDGAREAREEPPDGRQIIRDRIQRPVRGASLVKPNVAAELPLVHDGDHVHKEDLTDLPEDASVEPHCTRLQVHGEAQQRECRD
jgi:hypothetical protein